MCLQAKANAVPANGLKELPASPLAKLLQAAGLDMSTHSSSNVLAHPARAPAAAASQAAGCSSYPAAACAVSPVPQAISQGKPGNEQQQQQQQQPQQHQREEDTRSNAEVAAAALGLITRLRLALADKVEGILRDEFEEMWLDVVCAKPPWSDEDFLYVLHKHWRSVLQVGGRSARIALRRVLWLLNMSERIHMLQLLSVVCCILA
jgi:hypothetical protein